MNLFAKLPIILVFILTNVVYASFGFYFSMIVCGTISLFAILYVNEITCSGGSVPFSIMAAFWYALLVFPVWQYARLTESVFLFGAYLISLGLVAGALAGYRRIYDAWKEETWLRLVAVSAFVKQTHTRVYSRPEKTLSGDLDMATVSDTQRWIQELYDAGIGNASLHEMCFAMHDWDTVLSWVNGSTFGMPVETVNIICDLHRYFVDLEEFDIDEGLLDLVPEDAIDMRTQQLIDATHVKGASSIEGLLPGYQNEAQSESK
jgi:hypothetical protein